MSNLPDEIWRWILELGVEKSRLSYRDLCCLSIACRRLNRLAVDPVLWSTLMSFDFPSNSSSSSIPTPISHSKSLYKTKFERDRARKLASWRLSVLNVESQIAIHSNNKKNFWFLLSKEHDKMKAAAAELTNLEKLRQASVALNVWQPEIVRSSQKQLIEQSPVPIEPRVSALKMELLVCRQQIAIFNKAYNDEKRKLHERKEVLASMKYHPFQSFQPERSFNGCKGKRKKLKRDNSEELHPPSNSSEV